MKNSNMKRDLFYPQITQITQRRETKDESEAEPPRRQDRQEIA
jgi:hypothetical protein